MAAEVGNIERMRNLVDATKQWNLTDQWLTKGDRKGRTPIHLASIYGYLNVVEFIVDEVINSIDNEIRRDGRGRVIRRSGRSSSEIKKSSKRKKKQELKKKIRPNYQFYERLRGKVSTIFSLSFQVGLTTDTWCRHLVRHGDSGWSKPRYHS